MHDPVAAAHGGARRRRPFLAKDGAHLQLVKDRAKIVRARDVLGASNQLGPCRAPHVVKIVALHDHFYGLVVGMVLQVSLPKVPAGLLERSREPDDRHVGVVRIAVARLDARPVELYKHVVQADPRQPRRAAHVYPLPRHECGQRRRYITLCCKRRCSPGPLRGGPPPPLPPPAVPHALPRARTL